ncbi:hypothetical protein CYMTET_53686 [Cymbomonas tetramitiformis]|uniref:CobQ/CobB/MinD/ParA nucleotide binding domain-containing protein n=1 Tax=Cymbomonas tetramitiformis TaxID=36881 RepID=A0AAE0BGC6_9CHLO|nr:hypothetical protein CYMTET_53686 [Cymbomonas tetramitiformis]
MKTFLLAGTQSGVGKSSIAFGLMAALRLRQLQVQAFKVGPDFRDPLLYEVVTGRPCFNLDSWLLDQAANEATLHRQARQSDVGVIDGVMGLFDGLDGTNDSGSTAQMAKWLGVPVVLVIDCWAMGRSVAALVRGFQTFDEDVKISGLILNKVGSKAHAQWLLSALQSAGCAIPILGSLPKESGIGVPEQLLGELLEPRVTATPACDMCMTLCTTPVLVDAGGGG